MITNVPGDLWNFTKAEYKSPNVPVYLLLAGTTAGLIITDDQTYTSSHKFYLKKQFNKHMSDLFAEAGNGRTQFSLAACFAAYGFISDDHRALRTASEIVEAVLAAGTVVQVIKHITGREDPVRASSPGGTWRFFPGQKEYIKDVPKYDAFPSGHLATSVATFVVVAKNYPEYSNWITPISVALSTLISIGMVNNGIHWYSDYPLAIAIGYTFGKQISNRHSNKNNENKEGTNKLALVPFFDSQNLGLSVKLSF